MAVLLRGQEGPIRNKAISRLLERGYSIKAIAATLDISLAEVEVLTSTIKTTWSFRTLDIRVATSELHYALLHAWYDCGQVKRVADVCRGILKMQGWDEEKLTMCLKDNGFSQNQLDGILVELKKSGD